ncbi:MAG: regulatory protein RecX, partial [Pseudomonadota bacterium]
SQNGEKRRKKRYHRHPRFSQMESDELKKARNDAYSFLSCRPRTTEEVRRKLREKGYPSAVIAGVIERLQDLGYLNDHDFAHQFALFSIKNKLWGNLRITKGLRERGIPRGIVEETLKEVGREFEEEKIAQLVMEKKFSAFHPSKTDVKEKRRVIQHLKRRGFSWEVISRVVLKR